MSELTDEQRAMLTGPQARMRGYYIGFERTGNALVDQILSAVAYAAKGAHSTASWGDGSEYGYGPVPPGESFEWLIQQAANDAAERLAAGAVAEEPEWEYGVTTKWGMHAHPHLEGAERYAADVRAEIEQGRASGDLTFHGRVMKRTKAKAGPWVPVKQEGAET